MASLDTGERARLDAGRVALYGALVTHDGRNGMDDAQTEAHLDAVIQRRLATDAAYRNAENAEEQAAREDEIEREEWEKLQAVRELRARRAARGMDDPFNRLQARNAARIAAGEVFPIVEQRATIREGYPHPIAYTYEAAYHCPGCTAERFGVDVNGFPPETARDREGNGLGALAPWGEWQQLDGTREVLACDTCGREIDTYDGRSNTTP